MKIAFDAKRAFTNRSGLGNYSRNLITSAMKFHPEHKYILFSTVNESTIFSPENVEVMSGKGSVSWFWRTFGITGRLISEKIDIYHGLSNELPLNISGYNGKKIVTIHDVLFKRYPSYYPPIDRYIYDFKTRKACSVADLIVCISEQTKKDLLTFYNAPESKLKVVHQQVSPEFYLRNDDLQTVEKYELNRRYILYVGTIEERKDILTLLKAFKEVKDQDIMLYVVGGKRISYFRKVLTYIVENDLEERVIFFENIENHVLPLMYRKAHLVVYPSRFEGWGLPVAEAIASNAPVISTRNTSMEEAGGDACEYFEAGNDAELADVLNKYIESEITRQRLINKTFSRARLFDPEVCSKRMNEIYLMES